MAMDCLPLGPIGQLGMPAVIAPNNFKFKSLSHWSYNISWGCLHACSFCYVPAVATIKAEKGLEKSGVVPDGWTREREQGQHWGDRHWGEYCFLRTWDEKQFRKSLASAQKAKKVAPDSNRAVMFCTTTDPYQTFLVPGNPGKTKFLNSECQRLVQRALEIILEDSTLNVRILSRSPLAKRDFPLFKKFGSRLVFGMSLPTIDDKLSKVYEPGAPGPAAKLRTLESAVDEGLNVFVALAPTLPDDGENEIRRTLQAIMKLKPITIFHEPINLRAENVLRISKQAKALGRSVNTEVFRSNESWREYAFSQFSMVEKVASDLKIPEGVLHQWPDRNLGKKSGFLKMKRMQLARDSNACLLSKRQVAQIEKEWVEQVQPWLNFWHNPQERISSWPGIRTPNYSAQ